jgi:hypothetical protein
MNRFNVGSLSVALHRTVRVPEGRTPASLPPNLGTMELHRVSDYRQNCPVTWEDDAVFVCLHPKEALWLSFQPDRRNPVAVICGAGGVNALTGEKLSLTLAEGNYMVTPPQPWIDGWKDKDSGTVYQFVATEYKKGEGLTVAEQLIGAESQSGGIGLAVFEPLDRSKLKPEPMVAHSVTMDSAESFGGVLKSLSAGPTGQSVTRGLSFVEHGVGKGGAITQKIYPDPHGLDVWKPEPTSVMAIYIVSSVGYEAITGKTAPPSVVTSDKYSGPYFETHDKDKKDVQGSEKFTGLKSVFHQPEVAQEVGKPAKVES